MKLAGRYFLLKYKSCTKAFVKSAAFTIVVFSLLLIGVLAVSFSIQQNQVLPKIKIGAVIPESEGIIKKAVQFASSMNSVENTCEFYYLEESEARKGLETGDLQVVVILPVNFYQDVYQGINTPAEILMVQDDRVNTEVFEQLLTAAVSYLQTSEAGVYAVLDKARTEQTKMKYSNIGDFVAKNFVITLFDRMDLYDRKIISPLGKLDYPQYITVTFMVLVLLITGSNFSVLYQKSEKIVEQKLKSEGVTAVIHTLIKVMIMAVSLWAIWFLCYIGVCLVSKNRDLGVLWWDFFTPLYGFLVCICIAGFFHLVYELSGNGTFGALVLLFLNVGMVICSGLIIPQAYLSETVQQLGSVMPLTLWSDFIESFLFDTVSLGQVGGIIFVSMMEVAAGAVVAWKRL